MQNYRKPRLCKLPRDDLFAHQVWSMKLLVGMLESGSPGPPAQTELGSQSDGLWLLGNSLSWQPAWHQDPNVMWWGVR